VRGRDTSGPYNPCINNEKGRNTYMGAFATLLSWLSPVLHPLTDFRNNVTKLNTIHQDSVQTFGLLAGGLVEPQTGPDAFTGELADAFWNDVQTYLNTENALSGGGVGVAEEGVIDDAILACEECATDVTGAAEVAAGEIAGDAVLDEVTAVVDVAAVAEAGANPIADVAGIILTVIAGAAILGTLITLAWAIYNAVQRWQQAMNNISNRPLPKLPSNPTPVPAPTPVIPPVNLNQEQSLKKLEKEFPDVPPDVIAWLLAQGLTEQQIRNILKKLVAGGMSRLQIQQFFDKISSIGLDNDQIAKFLKNHADDIPKIWQMYSQVSNISGIDLVLYDIANGSKTNYKGSFFQLQWLVAHKDIVASVEAVDANNKQAADIILKDGTVIDVKSYDWKSQKSLDDLLKKIHQEDDTAYNRIKRQIERYKNLHPGSHLVYYFDSTSGKIPPDLQKLFDDEGVEVKYWPDPNPTKENLPLNG
jgi:hypothetical protein